MAHGSGWRFPGQMLRDNGRDSVGMDNAANPGNRQLTVMQDISGDKPVLSRHNPLADTTTVYRPGLYMVQGDTTRIIISACIRRSPTCHYINGEASADAPQPLYGSPPPQSSPTSCLQSGYSNTHIAAFWRPKFLKIKVGNFITRSPTFSILRLGKCSVKIGCITPSHQ